jgi:hypothetical protein
VVNLVVGDYRERALKLRHAAEHLQLQGDLLRRALLRDPAVRQVADDFLFAQRFVLLQPLVRQADP